jgi:thymidine phosphorylase
MAALVLGAGRARKEDVIAPGAGIVLDTYVGEHITAADADSPRLILHHDLAEGDPRLADALARARAAITITDAPLASPPPTSRILEVLR